MKPTSYGYRNALHPIYNDSPYAKEVIRHIKAIDKIRKHCEHEGLTTTKEIGLEHSCYEAFCPDCGQTWMRDY